MTDDATCTNEAPIRVLIADDHALFRHGLEQALAGEPDIEVVGEAIDGLDADRAGASSSHPDVVLMDVRMPGRHRRRGGARASAPRGPTSKVVMLTGSDDEEDLFAAVRAGATGYLLKEVSIDEVADAVRAVHRGDGLVAPSMVGEAARASSPCCRAGVEDDERGGAPKLTERELEVLRLVARGMSNKEIAAELVIAENTVKNHVRNILEKLQLRSRTEAAMYAVREKLVDPA